MDSTALPPARIFGDGDIVSERFRIVRLLGAGGMGEVYEAEDVLGRERVALKTLRTDLSDDADAVERLRNELQLTRRITHKNVCRVHDVYQHRTASGMRLLFTMELVDGETLAGRLLRGPLTPTTAWPILRQIAAALDAAHAAGVAHGDLKPGNVILDQSDPAGERAVVTDFGLARALPVDSGLTPTGSTRRWGTPAYMAPEQVLRGLVTRQTDVYSFGVMLCEIVTGQRPFDSASLPWLTLDKLRQDALPPEVASGLHPRWQAAIIRCLDPDPARRFGSTAAVLDAIEARATRRRWPWAAAGVLLLAVLGVVTPLRDSIVQTAARFWTRMRAAPAEERTVAVLPFTGETGDPNQRAYALGLTVAVTERLGALAGAAGGAYVVPHQQVIDTGVDTPAMVRLTLGADLIVTGRVGGTTDRALVTVSVTTAADDGLREQDRRTVMTRTVSGDQVVEPTVSALAALLDLGAGRSGASAQQVPERAAAERPFLVGLGHLLRGVSELPPAIAAFERAVREDEGYAAAYTALADAHLRRYESSRETTALVDAERTVDLAVVLDPLDARARVVRGRTYLATGQHKRAIAELIHAIEIDANTPLVRNHLAAAYEADGAIEMAEMEYRTAITLHPRYWSGYEDLGTFLYRRGRYAEAEQNYVIGIGLAPANRRAIANLAAVYEIQERFVAAENELTKGLKLSPDAILYNNLGWVYILDGKFEAAVNALQQAVMLPGSDSIVWSGLARARRWAGVRQQAIRDTYATAQARAADELRINPLNAEVRANHAYLLAETGRGRDALGEIATALASENARGSVTVLFRAALVHEWAGDRRAALAFLERAARGGYPLSRIARDPDLRALREDPRYRSIAEAVARPNAAGL